MIQLKMYMHKIYSDTKVVFKSSLEDMIVLVASVDWIELEVSSKIFDVDSWLNIIDEVEEEFVIVIVLFNEVLVDDDNGKVVVNSSKYRKDYFNKY